MNRIKGLDTIRFICAMWVAMNHIPRPIPVLDVSNPLWFLVDSLYKCAINGPAAVIVFFVISGFCIHYPYRDGKIVSVGEFYTRRYVRIGIPLVAAVILSQIIKSPLSFFNDAILWSLVAEIVYYTLYPIILNLKNRFGWRLVITASFLLSLVVISTNLSAKNYPSYGIGLNWLLGLPCWLLGCRLAEETENFIHLPSSKIWRWRFLIWFVSMVTFALRFKTPIGYPLTLNLFSFLVYFWLRQEIIHFQKKSPSVVLEKLGIWSYSLYLVHMLVAGIFMKNILRPAASFLDWSLLIVLMLSFSYAFFVLVENPSQILSKRIKDKLSARRISAVS